MVPPMSKASTWPPPSASPNQVAGLLLVTPFSSLVEVAAHHYPFLPVRLLLIGLPLGLLFGACRFPGKRFLEAALTLPIVLPPILFAIGTYHDLAAGLVERGVFDEKFLWQAVFYPAFLAGVYAVFGVSVLAATLVQAVLAGFLLGILPLLLGGVLVAGGALASILAMFWINRISWRVALVVALVAFGIFFRPLDAARAPRLRGR